MTTKTMPDLESILIQKQSQFDELKNKLSTLQNSGILFASLLSKNDQIKYAILGSFYLWADLNNKSKIYSGKENPSGNWKIEHIPSDDENYLNVDGSE